MIDRIQALALEKQKYASFAALSSLSLGRQFKEDSAEFRTEFQRDRDRIVHSSAFRRMEYKTQVFVNHEGDHYRTRLTHSLEVAQIGRTVGRALQLNEDLMEALILSHDLGHTPFGHAGEREMSRLMKDQGGFEHNQQSLRIVDYLENKYPNFRGLNLSFEVREGIIKHSGHWTPQKVPAELKPNEQPALEAQLIDLVDEIAYNNHDIDDGLSSGMITLDMLQEVALWKRAQTHVLKKYPGLTGQKLKYSVISVMISILVSDLIQTTFQNIQKEKIKTYPDLRALGKTVVGMSEEIGKQNKELKGFLWENLYTHHRVIRMEEKAKRVIRDLFEAFMSRPEQLPKELREEYKHEPLPRMICDYIAGMTDRFATEEHERLFDPKVRV